MISTIKNNLDFDFRMDKSFVKKGKLSEQGNDFDFWQTQPYEKRLATVEAIGKEYYSWKYGSEQRLQRVYTIVNTPELDNFLK